MFDNDILKDVQAEHERDMIVSALKTLAATSIFELQEARLIARLTAGAAEESEDQLVARVREYKRNHQALVQLKSLGDTLTQRTKS